MRIASALCFGVALGLGLTVAGCSPHTVVNVAPPGAQSGLIVTGIGKARAKPDIARTTIGVEARAATAEQAIADVNARMAQVIAAVKAAGVAEADVRTSNLSLNFERIYEEPPRPVEAPAPAPPGKLKPVSAPPEVVAAPPPQLPRGFYNASSSVEVTIRKLRDAGKVISAATGSGANQLFGIRFELEDNGGLLSDARQKAVEDARARAERLAALAGVKLGPAMSIVEMDGGSVPPGPMMPMAMKSVANDAAPIEAGEVVVTTSVQISYALPSKRD